MSQNNTSNNTSGNYKRIPKPDVSVRDKKLELLNNQLKKLNLEIDSVRGKIDKSMNSSDNTKRTELTDKLKEIIKVQSDLKQKRNGVFDSLKNLDANLKRKQAEIDSKLNGVSLNKKFQSIDDINNRLEQIEQDMSTGDLSIVEEKILVKEMASLNKLKKNFVLVQPIKVEIDQLKIEISNLKNQLNTELNSKAVSQEFEKTNNELNELRSSQSTEQNAKNLLFNKRAALYAKRDEIYSKIKTIREDFENEYASFKLKLEQEKVKRNEENKLNKLLEQKETDLSKLNEKLIHAKNPAFQQELSSIENVLLVLDPSYEKPKPKSLFPTNTTTTTTSTTTTTNTPGKLTPIVSKKFESTIVVGGGKKGKKNKHAGASSTSSSSTAGGKFSLEPSLIGILSELDVDIPITQDQVAKTVEQLKAKHKEYEEHQDEQTEINIKAVQDKIEQVKKAYDTKEEEIKQQVASEAAAKVEAEA